MLDVGGPGSADKRWEFDLDDVVERIVGFLRDVGIVVREDGAVDGSFLPGVYIDSGELVVDRSRLQWPGDLLHEAGHLAVTPAAMRGSLSDALEGQLVAAGGGEIEATAWAYAACVALELDASVLFHDGGYHGCSSGLIMTYALGVYPGCAGLAKAGLTRVGADAEANGVAPYPNMIRWLRA